MKETDNWFTLRAGDWEAPYAKSHTRRAIYVYDIKLLNDCCFHASPGGLRVGLGKVKTGGRGFPGGSVVKNPPANAGDTGSIPDSGRSHMLGSK